MKMIRKTGKILTIPAASLFIFGISDLCESFVSGLSRIRISAGRTVTHPMTPSSTPFAMTIPRSRPSVKLIKHRAMKPAIVVTDDPRTELKVLWIATAIASLLSSYCSFCSL